MRRFLIAFLPLLFIYGALIVALPETTVSPGDLLRGHEDIASDCLACHAPLRGAAPERCLTCHLLEEIDVVTTRGEPLSHEGRVHFHEGLQDPACMACHGDHEGPDSAAALVGFSHDLLDSSTQPQCVRCHGDQRPDDDRHRDARSDCRQCHHVDAWKPAFFDHALLGATEVRDCVSCHDPVRPADALHRDAGDECGSCHRVEAWTPATFEHDRYFRFDRHHPSDCRSCHPQSLSLYTCYECHEHNRTNMAREHREEGIESFERCVECHRSGDEHEAERRWRSLGGGKRPRDRGREGRHRHDDHDEDSDD